MGGELTHEKEQLHELVERLAPSQVHAVRGLLRVMLDPVSRAIANAQPAAGGRALLTWLTTADFAAPCTRLSELTTVQFLAAFPSRANRSSMAASAVDPFRTK